MPDPEPPKEPDPADAEKSFWDKFDAKIDAALEKRLKGQTPPTTNPPPPPPDPPKNDPPPPGTSRMKDKRVTLPGLIADMVFGPAKE